MLQATLTSNVHVCKRMQSKIPSTSTAHHHRPTALKPVSPLLVTPMSTTVRVSHSVRMELWANATPATDATTIQHHPLALVSVCRLVQHRKIRVPATRVAYRVRVSAPHCVIVRKHSMRHVNLFSHIAVKYNNHQCRHRHRRRRASIQCEYVRVSVVISQLRRIAHSPNDSKERAVISESALFGLSMQPRLHQRLSTSMTPSIVLPRAPLDLDAWFSIQHRRHASASRRAPVLHSSHSTPNARVPWVMNCVMDIVRICQTIRKTAARAAIRVRVGRFVSMAHVC
jgi:hypothetical protein